MTQILDVIVAKMTRTEAQILAGYAASETTTHLASRLGISRDVVTQATEELAGNDRGRAGALTAKWNERARAVAAARPPAGRPETLTAAAPRPRPVPQPAPQEALQKAEPGLAADGGLEALLAAAEDSGQGKLTRVAERIRVMLASLGAEVSAYQQEQQLRAELAACEARAAAIRQQLRPARPSGVIAASRAETVVPDRVVREWAVQARVECPARGRVPSEVREQYARRAA